MCPRSSDDAQYSFDFSEAIQSFVYDISSPSLLRKLSVITLALSVPIAISTPLMHCGLENFIELFPQLNRAYSTADSLTLIRIRSVLLTLKGGALRSLKY